MYTRFDPPGYSFLPNWNTNTELFALVIPNLGEMIGSFKCIQAYSSRQKTPLCGVYQKSKHDRNTRVQPVHVYNGGEALRCAYSTSWPCPDNRDGVDTTIP